MLPTAHQDQRTVARAHVTSYTAQMKATMQKLQKRPKNIKKDDLVYLRIPNADKNKFDRTKLACKVIQVCGNGLCQLGCSLGILNVRYSIDNLELIEQGVHYPELNDIPKKSVTLRKAASAQSLVNLTKITCNCKTKCTSNRCVCHKASVSCSSNCHPCNRKCDNFN